MLKMYNNTVFNSLSNPSESSLFYKVVYTCIISFHFYEVDSFFLFVLTWEQFFIAFGEKGRKGVMEREKNIDVREKHWLSASHTIPDPGWYAPRLGIEPATFRLQDNAPTNWATLSRANSYKVDSIILTILKNVNSRKIMKPVWLNRASGWFS